MATEFRIEPSLDWEDGQHSFDDRLKREPIRSADNELHNQSCTLWEVVGTVFVAAVVMFAFWMLMWVFIS